MNVRSAFTPSIDTTITLEANILSGTRLITSSTSSIDFDTTALCVSSDSIVVLRNRGCDTLRIDSATFSDAGFRIDDPGFPFELLRGDSIILHVHSLLDTAGSNLRSTSVLNVFSNSGTPLPPIDLSQEYRYPILSHITTELSTVHATAKDTLIVSLMIDTLPTALYQINANLNIGNTDLLTFVRSQSANTLIRDDQTISILGNPIVAPGGVLAQLFYSVALTKDSVTEIRLSDVQLNQSDPSY